MSYGTDKYELVRYMACPRQNLLHLLVVTVCYIVLCGVLNGDEMNGLDIMIY